MLTALMVFVSVTLDIMVRGKWETAMKKVCLINPLQSGVAFLYHLKTSENPANLITFTEEIQVF